MVPKERASAWGIAIRLSSSTPCLDSGPSGFDCRSSMAWLRLCNFFSNRSLIRMYKSKGVKRQHAQDRGRPLRPKVLLNIAHAASLRADLLQELCVLARGHRARAGGRPGAELSAERPVVGNAMKVWRRGALAERTFPQRVWSELSSFLSNLPSFSPALAGGAAWSHPTGRGASHPRQNRSVTRLLRAFHLGYCPAWPPSTPRVLRHKLPLISLLSRLACGNMTTEYCQPIKKNLRPA